MSVLRLLSLVLPLVMTLAAPAGFCADIRFVTEPTVKVDDSGRSVSGESELTRDLMNRLKLSGDIAVYPWKRAYSLLKSEPNIALFPTTRTQAREQDAHWVGPILKVSWVFYARKEAGIELNDLQDAKQVGQICGYFGDAKLNFLESQGFTNLVAKYRSFDCIELLAKGRVDLWISTTNAPLLFSETDAYHASDLEIVYTIAEKYLYYAVSKEVPAETVSQLQQTLDDMKHEGVFFKHYDGHYSDAMIREISVVEEPDFPWLSAGQR